MNFKQKSQNLRISESQNLRISESQNLRISESHHFVISEKLILMVNLIIGLFFCFPSKVQKTIVVVLYFQISLVVSTSPKKMGVILVG
jgi:hypothetical protein